MQQAMHNRFLCCANPEHLFANYLLFIGQDQLEGENYITYSDVWGAIMLWKKYAIHTLEMHASLM